MKVKMGRKANTRDFLGENSINQSDCLYVGVEMILEFRIWLM